MHYYENYKNLIKRFSFVNFALHQALNIKKQELSDDLFKPLGSPCLSSSNFSTYRMKRGMDGLFLPSMPHCIFI